MSIGPRDNSSPESRRENTLRCFLNRAFNSFAGKIPWGAHPDGDGWTVWVAESYMSARGKKQVANQFKSARLSSGLLASLDVEFKYVPDELWEMRNTLMLRERGLVSVEEYVEHLEDKVRSLERFKRRTKERKAEDERKAEEQRAKRLRATREWILSSRSLPEARAEVRKDLSSVAARMRSEVEKGNMHMPPRPAIGGETMGEDDIFSQPQAEDLLARWLKQNQRGEA